MDYSSQAELTAEPDDWMGPEELRLVIEVDDGSGCPGLMAVVLGMDGEQVSWERRYHDIMSVRRCYDPATLQTGWWDELQIPSTIVAERTGTVSYGDIELEVFNGTQNWPVSSRVDLPGTRRRVFRSHRWRRSRS